MLPFSVSEKDSKRKMLNVARLHELGLSALGGDLAPLCSTLHLTDLIVSMRPGVGFTKSLLCLQPRLRMTLTNALFHEWLRHIVPPSTGHALSSYASLPDDLSSLSSRCILHY